jgi:hypothetical protein
MTCQTRNALKTNPAVIKLSAREVEVLITDADGDTDYDATDRAADDVAGLLNWGGYRSGFGSWVLRADYESRGGDACDASSPVHY